MTSHWPMIRSAVARPAGALMSRTMLFLLRLNVRKKPMPRPGRLRVLSPPGGSTLITSAPRSARIMPQVGPMTMCVNSMTRTPSRGSGCAALSVMPGRSESRRDLLERAFRHRHVMPVAVRRDDRRLDRLRHGAHRHRGRGALVEHLLLRVGHVDEARARPVAARRQIVQHAVHEMVADVRA